MSYPEETLMLKRTFFRAFSDDDHDMDNGENPSSATNSGTLAGQKPSEALKLLSQEYYLVNSAFEQS